MNSGLSQNPVAKYPDSIGAELLSIALIGPDEERRRPLADALAECHGAKVREFSSYPRAIDDVPRLLDLEFDVIILDLDSDLEFALDLVENICAKDAATVMVYSSQADQDLVVRCMRAGAREYLIPPFDQNAVAEALVRAAAIHRPRTRPAKKALGKSLVFLGAKGGSGVTTIACNFSIALAQESNQSTLLIDLALPMGDAALNLGIAAEYSTDNALQDAERLDASFLLKLLARHQSGVSVLAAPSKVPEVEASREAIDKLMAVARQEFDNVIVDAGSRIDLMGTSLFKEASTIYLVTQAGISELRNSNRLISRFFDESGPKLEVVINRYEPGFLGVTEEVITKAISRPVRWKIPDDYDATRQIQNSSSSLSDSPVSRLILEMASSVTGLPVPQEKKKGFSFKGFGRGAGDKGSSPDKPGPDKASNDKPTGSDRPTGSISILPAAPGVAPTIEWPVPEPIAYGTKLSAAQLNATASAPGKFVYTPGPGYMLPAGTHTLWVTFNPAESSDDAPVQAAVSIAVSKATPAVTWPEPAPIEYGTPLAAAQLNASTTVRGKFVYSPAAGEVLSAGEHTLSATFTPADSTNSDPAQAAVFLRVAKATPALAWTAPHTVMCGEPLGADHLNATASVPGTFVYSPAAGDVLTAGTHTLSATFTPADETNFDTAQAGVSITVAQAIPAISWPTPDKITYGSPLGAGELNATASVPGTFVYNPAAGSILAVGEHTPSVIFTPADLSGYTTVQVAVALTVAKAMPAIAWPAPDSIPSGAPLSAAQLNAAASVAGTLVYSPAAGEILSPGAHTLSVTFSPADTMNYTTAQANVSIVVTETVPTPITWPAPSSISYGTPLGSAQLSAAASVPGTFVYAPPAGDVLAPGKHKLTAFFTPADTERYATAHAAVTLFVEGLPNLGSLLKAAAHSPFGQNVHTGHSASAETNRKAVISGGASAQKLQRETRTYKGAIYEKGEDGQWHLQQK